MVTVTCGHFSAMTAHVGPPYKMPYYIELKPRNTEKTHRHSQLQLVIVPQLGLGVDFFDKTNNWIRTAANLGYFYWSHSGC
jgi:hypothetical protein